MTILIDEITCTRCGICSVVCTLRIIGPADKTTLPRVKDEKAGMSQTPHFCGFAIQKGLLGSFFRLLIKPFSSENPDYQGSQKK